MARRSYDRMYKTYDNEEKKELEDVKIVEEKKEDLPPQENTKVEKKALQTGKVIGGLNLNVRKQPQANGEIVGTVRDGAAVQIIETANEDWYHIASPDGYVMKKYVQA